MFDLSPPLADVIEALGLLSVVTFIASLLVIPWLIGRLPASYFLRHRQKVDERHRRHPLVARIIFVLRNSVGLILLLAGMAMLVLPGQGLITILIGISFMDFPKKHQLEEVLVRRPGVIRSLNWLRRKQNKEPFLL